MNKANVFLLVVVSSLLTYISTATASVAQEKWEYGVSEFRDDVNNLTYSFKSRTFYKEINLNRPAGIFSITTVDENDPEQDGAEFETEAFKPVGALTLENWVKLKKTDFRIAAVEIHSSLGDDGWHPYQVNTLEPDEGPVSIWKHQIFWRRRVQ